MRVMASRTSSSAGSSAVSRWNSTKVTDCPSVTEEIVRLTPSSVATAFSTRRVTSVSSCAGAAPGRFTVTVTIGKAMSGKRETGSWWNANSPATHSAMNSRIAGSGTSKPGQRTWNSSRCRNSLRYGSRSTYSFHSRRIDTAP